MVDRGVDDAINNGLGDDAGGLLLAAEAERFADVLQGDARIGVRQGPEAGLDHIVPEPLDQHVGVILLEQRLVFITFENWFRSPPRTARTIAKYGFNSVFISSSLNNARSGISPVKSSTITANLVAVRRKPFPIVPLVGALRTAAV